MSGLVKVWTRAEIIAAIQRFAKEHGRAPHYREWRKSTATTPGGGQVADVFGRWSLGIEAAGLPRPLCGGNVGSEPRTVALGDDRPFPMGGVEAGRFGSIVTLENADGKRLVLHRTGTVRGSVKQAVREALVLDETFRVVSVSTPTSIFGDLQGNRNYHTPAWPTLPERALVPADLMHPSIRLAEQK